jgi:hypothetical protein
MFRVTKHQQNDRKCWKIPRTHPRRLSLNNPWACRHYWDRLWSLPGNLNTKFEHALHCFFITTTRPPTRPWKPQSLWLTGTWLSFPIQVISLCFPNRKQNWRNDILKQRLTSKGNRKRYSTALRKMNSMVLLKRGKNDGITVYVLKETILKKMAAKIEYIKPAFLFWPRPGTF